MEATLEIFLEHIADSPYDVHFGYRVDRETDWYDLLAKRSRFASLTPIWRGSVESNTIRFIVTDDSRENAK
jgi:hypothetical protein